MTKEDLEELTKKMRFNLTALQAQLSDVQRAIAGMVAPDEPTHRCECGWSGRSTYQFEEHRYRQHDGPVPEHYLAAERAAGYEHVITTNVQEVAVAGPLLTEEVYPGALTGLAVDGAAGLEAA